MSKKGGKKRLYLLDAMALAYRSHFIFINRPLVNSKGENTSAAYGFTSALLKLIEDHKIEHIAVVFDALDEGGTFRDELYEDYKAHREPPPDELIENIPRIKKVVEAFDIPVFEVPGVEADDVIGTLARLGEADGAEVIIVSPDKDFQQLLSDSVTLFRPAYRGEEFDPITAESFREKWGVEPEQFIDIQALWGDSTDNVPGIPGIGEKTATQLIQQYGSVENLIEHASEVKGKRAREGLIALPDQARLSKELVAIKTDVDLELDWKEVHQARPNARLIREAFTALEFNALLKRTERILNLNGPDSTAPSLFPDAPASAPSAEEADVEAADFDDSDFEFRLITSMEKLSGLQREFGAADRIGLSVVLTDDSNPMMAGVIGIALAAGDVAAYAPVPLPDGTTMADVSKGIEALLGDGRDKFAHNAKPSLVALARSGVEAGGDLFDTMVAHYLCAPEQPHGLSALLSSRLGLRIPGIDELLGTGREAKSIADVAPAEVGRFFARRVHLCSRLVDRLGEELARDGLTDVAEKVEFPLIRVLADVERTGVRVDVDILGEISGEMDGQIRELEERVFELAGTEFNIGSPAQIGEILFDKLGLPVVSKTSTGKPSTRESVLVELATQHELPAAILDWRELSKLKSTYVDALPQLVNPETGRIHTNYNQTVTATGRLSSQNPNLQNIPIRTERGRGIRRAFVAEPGFRLMSADYVQIELRILASMSGDPGLIEAFERGDDIHTATAARMFGIGADEVTRVQRTRAKEVNYGIPYGMSAFGLAQRLRCPRAEAQELIDGYNRSYAKVAGFLAKQVESVREKGYAETLMGRRRYIPDINARNRVQRAAAERIAFNMPIQGTQADMIKLAMIAIHRETKRRGLRSRMIMQVHDELVLEVPPEESAVVEELVREEMINALPLDVPVEVELSFGDNWLDAH